MSPTLRQSLGADFPDETVFAAPFLGSAQQGAVAAIVQAVLNRYPMVALTGPAGIGKTTALHEAVGQLRAYGERIVEIELSRSDRVQLAEVAAQALGRRTVPLAQPALDTLIRKTVAAQHDLGSQLLVVDDVHLLLPETLQFLHRLAAWPAGGEPPWQVLLSGRPDFWDTVQLGPLREVGSAIAIRHSLDRLTDAEAQAFVAYHLGRSENAIREVIADGALRRLLEAGQGVPGRLAALLDQACATADLRADGIIARDVVAAAPAVRASRSMLAQPRREPAGSPVTDRWFRRSLGGVGGILMLAIGVAGWRLLAGAGLGPHPQDPRTAADQPALAAEALRPAAYAQADRIDGSPAQFSSDPAGSTSRLRVSGASPRVVALVADNSDAVADEAQAPPTPPARAPAQGAEQEGASDAAGAQAATEATATPPPEAEMAPSPSASPAEQAGTAPEQGRLAEQANPAETQAADANMEAQGGQPAPATPAERAEAPAATPVAGTQEPAPAPTEQAGSQEPGPAEAPAAASPPQTEQAETPAAAAAAQEPAPAPTEQAGRQEPGPAETPAAAATPQAQQAETPAAAAAAQEPAPAPTEQAGRQEPGPAETPAAASPPQTERAETAAPAPAAAAAPAEAPTPAPTEQAGAQPPPAETPAAAATPRTEQAEPPAAAAAAQEPAPAPIEQAGAQPTPAETPAAAAAPQTEQAEPPAAAQEPAPAPTEQAGAQPAPAETPAAASPPQTEHAETPAPAPAPEAAQPAAPAATAQAGAQSEPTPAPTPAAAPPQPQQAPAAPATTITVTPTAPPTPAAPPQEATAEAPQRQALASPPRIAQPQAPPAPPTGVAPAAANVGAASGAKRMPEAMMNALLSRGDALFAVGDVSAARLFYERAAEGGSARAAAAAGKTYDPAFLATIKARGMEPDPKAAADWYRTAAGRGDAEAPQLLRRLGAGPNQ